MNLQSLTISPELLRIISEIDKFNGAWNVRNNVSSETLFHLQYVATIESIGSSTRIEGSQLNDNQIESLLSDINEHSFTLRDEQEVAGYYDAMQTVLTHYEFIDISENYIKQLHKVLFKHTNKNNTHRGEYKKQANNVEAFDEFGKNLGIVFETTSVFETPSKMSELILWTQNTLKDKSYHPLIVIAVFNVVFLAIHPFTDGNGRLSRILVSLLMLKAGYTYIAYSSLESIIEHNKEGYYIALQRTQKTLKKNTNWEPWLEFFCRSLLKQKEHLDSKVKHSDIYAHLPQESIIILQYLQQHQRITISEACTIITSISRASIKNRLGALVFEGYITKHGKARATWYSLNE